VASPAETTKSRRDILIMVHTSLWESETAGSGSCGRTPHRHRPRLRILAVYSRATRAMPNAGAKKQFDRSQSCYLSRVTSRRRAPSGRIALWSNVRPCAPCGTWSSVAHVSIPPNAKRETCAGAQHRAYILFFDPHVRNLSQISLNITAEVFIVRVGATEEVTKDRT
jgi:hypothetical protein